MRHASTATGRRHRRGNASSVDPMGSTRSIDRGLRSTLQSAVCDQAEILWIDQHSRRLGLGLDLEPDPWSRRRQTVELRAIRGGRFGTFRLGHGSWPEIESGLRNAAAAALASPPSHRAFSAKDGVRRVRGFDKRVARFSEDGIRDLLEAHRTADDAVDVGWTDAQVLLYNTNGLRLSQRVTSLQIQVRHGRGAGAGFASDATRRLDGIDIGALFARARSRAGASTPDAMDFGGDHHLVLAPEATAELVDMLNHRAFSADAYCQGTSFLREHLGVQVFDRNLTLRDDGTDEAGLPFPFDLEGRPKRPTVLVDRGTPRTPTLDASSAITCGLEATGHAVGPGEAFALNLFMEPGSESEADLLGQCDGGIWIGRIEDVECFDPSRMLIRARCRGVRRIKGGHLAGPLPDLLWEDSLLRIFSSFDGIGRTTARRLSRDRIFGGTCAPAVAIGNVQSLRPASERD